jgi:hypothetical protein
MKASRLVAMTMSSVLLAGVALIVLVSSTWSRLERSQQQLDRAVSMQHQAERLDDAVHAWLLLGDRSRISDSVLREGAAGQAVLADALLDRLTGAAPDSVAAAVARTDSAQRCTVARQPKLACSESAGCQPARGGETPDRCAATGRNGSHRK